MEKKTPKKYPLTQLYLDTSQRKIKVGLYDEEQNKYFDLANNNITNTFQPTISFLEALEKNKLDILITDIDGNQMGQLSASKIEDLIKILERKRNMKQNIKSKSDVISSIVVDVVSDLLGLNISISKTRFNFKDRLKTVEVIVPAKKLQLFKEYLLECLEASWLTDFGIYLTYETSAYDYRISRSLNKAKIKQDRIRENNFTVYANQNGEIRVNNVPINGYSEREKQKIIKF